jgi:cyclic lactone autoinducer peptide
MGKIRFTVLTVLVSLVTLLAFTGASAACSSFHYEPPVPSSLKKY